MGAVRARLTYANVGATLAVFAALGGTAYGAFVVPKDSVRSATIRNGAVKAPDLGRGAIIASKIDNASLTPADVSRAALPAGARGDQGPRGRKGATGGTGPAPIENHLLRLDGEQNIPQGEFQVAMTGSTWTQKAGQANVAVGIISVLAGSCASGERFIVTGSLDGGAPFVLVDTISDEIDEQLFLPLTIPAPDVDTERTIVIGASNDCGAQQTISRLDIDIVGLG